MRENVVCTTAPTAHREEERTAHRGADPLLVLLCAQRCGANPSPDHALEQGAGASRRALGQGVELRLEPAQDQDPAVNLGPALPRKVILLVQPWTDMDRLFEPEDGHESGVAQSLFGALGGRW